MSRIHEQRKPPQRISSFSFFGTIWAEMPSAETGISSYLRKTRSLFFRLFEIGFRWGKTLTCGRAWTINLQAIGSTRWGTRFHINVTGILDGKFKLRDLSLLQWFLFSTFTCYHNIILHAILSFSNYNVSLYVRPWRRKVVPSEILVKRYIYSRL